jgi:uncharacterized protein YbaA (DUF1428 family)
MANYVDGFVIPIKKKNLKAYKKMAADGCKIWMEHGALDYYETIGDMLNLPYGRTFPKMCKLKSDETVIFSWIVYKSKADRKKILKKVDNDPRMKKYMNSQMPFEMKRFCCGGFKVLVQAK